MTDLLQLLIAGLATGAIYALAAIGFTLLWQTSQTINFAQGEFVMLPAFFALIAHEMVRPAVPRARWCSRSWPRCCCWAWCSRFVVVAPLIRRGVLPLVVSTIALSIILKER